MVYFVTEHEDYLFSNQIKFVKPFQIEGVIEESKIICEDTETIGLDPHVKNPLLLIQIGTLTDQYIFDVKSEIDLSSVKKILENRKILKVLANGIFERQMLRSCNIQLNSMFDVSLAAQVIRQGKEVRKVFVGNDLVFIYSLAGLFKEYLNIEIDKEQQKSFISHKGDKYSLDQLLYAAEDVKLYGLYEELLRRLIKLDLINPEFDLSLKVENMVKNNVYYKAVLEFKVQEYFADMLYNGINLDKKAWKDLFYANIKKKYEVEVALNTALPQIDKTKTGWRVYPVKVDEVVQNSLFGEPEANQKKAKPKYQMNWGSSKQLMPILKLVLGKIPTDKHGKETISNKELIKLPERYTNPFIAKLIEYSSVNKAINTYGLKYLENISPITGRIHFQINQLLETGRIAPKKPNLAQIPSGKEWRSCFTSPKGWLMVGADYSAQESQVMADKSKDSIFIDFFQNGDGDSHSMIATRVFTAKENREIVVKKTLLKVEHKGEISGELEQYAKRLFPEADVLTYDSTYLILDSSEPDKEKKPSNPLRQQGKTLNFFISFGGSDYTLSIDKGIPIKEAKALIDGFWKGFPELKIYFDKEKEFAINKGYSLVNSITRAKRWYPTWKEYRGYELRKEEKLKELIKAYGEQAGKNAYFKGMKNRTLGLSEANSKSFKLKGDIERAAMNTGIQGTAADMTKTSCILMMEELEEKGYGLIGDIKPVNCIHDENLLQVKEELAEYSKDMLKRNMEKASTLFLSVLKIKAASYAANNWKH